MDILLCTDCNYILPSKVMVKSLCINNKDVDLIFHIFCNSDSIPGVALLAEWIHSCGAECHIYQIDESLCSVLPFGRPDQPNHVSIASYYRLFMASVLPASIHKVLYLDGDIIVRGSLKELWDIDLSGKAIGCIQDMTEDDYPRYNKLQYYPGEGYFNAGVLLVNLEYWRANGVESRCVEFARMYPERIVFHDQDVLNFVLRNEKIRLPFKYNVQDGFLYETKHFLTWPYGAELVEAETDPVILHFSTGNKPWKKNCNHPYLEEYLKYVDEAGADLSAFPQKKEKLSMYMTLRQMLVKIGLFKPLVQFEEGLELR